MEESHTPRAHKDFIFWFSVFDFLLPGIYTLRFMPEPFSKDIKPLCLRVEVHARRAPVSLRSVLNSQLSFLNVSRGGRYSLRQSLELDIPEAADEVVALRIALLQLKETLPLGALIESQDDLVTAGTGGGAGLYSPAPSGGGGGSGSGSGSNTLKAPPCFWTPAVGEQWMNHLMEATTAQEVMEGLVLLESCMHPDWLKPWYGSLRRAYAASWAHLLRVGTTPAVVAFHLFVLDKAILYDKERRAPRKARGRLAAGGGGAEQQQQPPYRRVTNTSRLAELSGEEDEEEDFEATETESDEEDDDSDDEWSAGRGKRKARGRAAKQAPPQKKRAKKAEATASASSSRSGRAAAAPHRYAGRRRTHVNSYREQEDDIAEESEEEGSRGGRSSLGGGDVTQEELLHVVSLLTQHQSAGLFIEPVDERQVPDYYEVIKKPMCLSEMESRVKAGNYAGLGLDAFAKDLGLIWENAARYNGANTEIAHLARELKAAFEEWARGRKRTRFGAR